MKVALILLAVCAIFCQLFILDVLSIIWWFIPSGINLTFAGLAYLWLRPRSSLLLASVGAVLVSVVLAFNVSFPRTVEHIWSNFALQSSGAKKAIFEIERGSKIYLDSKLQEVSYLSRAFNWPRYRSDLFPLIRIHGSGYRGYDYSGRRIENFASSLEFLKFKVVPFDEAEYILAITESSVSQPNYLQFSLLKGADLIAEEKIYRHWIKMDQKQNHANELLVHMDYLLTNTFWHYFVRSIFDKPRHSTIDEFFEGRIIKDRRLFVIIGTSPQPSKL